MTITRSARVEYIVIDAVSYTNYKCLWISLKILLKKKKIKNINEKKLHGNLMKK